MSLSGKEVTVMKDWIEGFQDSIDYIEQNLQKDLDVAKIAEKAALSSFYYQRIFGAMCGVTVGEYIRSRRMTLAAQELACSDRKVIDIAMKYGYDSPDSFSKAFHRFHGISPAQAREAGASLRSFAPLHIRITLEGGTMVDYKIVEKAPFTVVGIKKRFDAETSYRDVPAFWGEWMADRKGLKGMFGICTDMDGKNLDYWIADLYLPWEDIPAGCEAYQIPGGQWALFRCEGALPDSMQKVNRQIWSEWLPALQGYALAGNYVLEFYQPPADDPSKTVSYLCIPLKKSER
jgi:AraC family transcriptional regulator